MGKQRSKVCGMDVHKKFLVATITDRTGNKETKKFSNEIEPLLRLREWILVEHCEAVAFESTGEYWYSLHDVLTQIAPV